MRSLAEYERKEQAMRQLERGEGAISDALRQKRDGREMPIDKIRELFPTDITRRGRIQPE